MTEIIDTIFEEAGREDADMVEVELQQEEPEIGSEMPIASNYFPPTWW
jgi:hypothetical protein